MDRSRPLAIQQNISRQSKLNGKAEKLCFLKLKFEYECNSKHMSTWMGLEATLFALILVWGLVVVYSTWKVKESIHESRWLLLSIYNIVVVLAILIPLCKTMNLTDNSLFYIAGSFSSHRILSH